MSVVTVSANRAAVLRSRPAGPPERGPAEGRAAKTGPVRRRERQLAGWCLSAGLLLAFQALVIIPLQAQNTRATGKPHVIYGEPYVGKTVTANKGTIADADGLSKAENGEAGYAYGYQWVRVDGDEEEDISGATDSTYTLTEADEGRRVRVRVSFRDDLDNDESRTSDDFPFYGSIQAGATPAKLSDDDVELVGNSRQTVAAVLESAGGAFHRRLAQSFTVRAGVDYTLEEVTVCARGDNRGWLPTRYLPGASRRSVEHCGLARGGSAPLRPPRARAPTEFPKAVLAPIGGILMVRIPSGPQQCRFRRFTALQRPVKVGIGVWGPVARRTTAMRCRSTESVTTPIATDSVKR